MGADRKFPVGQKQTNNYQSAGPPAHNFFGGACGFAKRLVRAGDPRTAFIAQLGERQTEDLKVPSSILGEGTFLPSRARDAAASFFE